MHWISLEHERYTGVYNQCYTNISVLYRHFFANKDPLFYLFVYVTGTKRIKVKLALHRKKNSL